MGTAAVTVSATVKTPTASRTPPSSSSHTGRPPPLTQVERDWLAANDGCFKCRLPNVGHRSRDCDTFAPIGRVVPVPPGWKRHNTASNSTTATQGTGKVGIRALAIADDDFEDIKILESLAAESDADSD